MTDWHELVTWQRGILVPVHPRELVSAIPIAPIVNPERFKDIRKRVVRAMEVDPTYGWLKSLRDIGCDSQRCFYIHPEDCGCENAHVCEHEFLTD